MGEAVTINKLVQEEVCKWLRQNSGSVYTLPAQVSVKPLAAYVSQRINDIVQKKHMVSKGVQLSGTVRLEVAGFLEEMGYKLAYTHHYVLSPEKKKELWKSSSVHVLPGKSS